MGADGASIALPFELRPRRRPALPEGPYLIAGLGQSGRAAAEALGRAGVSTGVVASDRYSASVPKRVRRALEAIGVRIHLGDQDQLLDSRPTPRTLIKSPGISFETPLVRLAGERRVAVLDELELGWRLSGVPMIAVTGTNGKTTTSTLAADVLGRSGLRVALAGNADTAPPLSALGDDRDLVVCEVSSFQLEGCPALLPEVAVFTNLTHDHLPRHGTMRRYGEIKRRLFLRGGEAVPLAVIDTVDGFGRKLADEVEAAGGRVLRVGVGAEADYRIQRARWDLRSAEVELSTPDGLLTLETRLPGLYNARNVAAVVALCDQLGVKRSILTEELAINAGAAGRFEHIGTYLDHELILDVAASPVAVEQFLCAVRVGMDPGARLHTVLGVLGAPDPANRRATGGTARALCDRLILTAGSFRSNAPLGTLESLVAGANLVAGAELAIVPDREEAIARAIDGASSGDVVSVLGRGNIVEVIRDSRLDDRSALAALAGVGGVAG